MSEIVGDNTNPLITKCMNKCKVSGVKYVKEIIYKHKVINNISLTKTQLNRLNKNALYNLIDKHNIDIDKYINDSLLQEYRCDFMFNMRYMDHGNNIHKPYKYRKLVNYFRFLNF